jgi:hypothetical protein
MKGKLMGACAAVTLAVSFGIPAVATADPGNGNNCHAYFLQLAKFVAGTNSAAATAAYFDVTVQQGQEEIGVLCGQS